MGTGSARHFWFHWNEDDSQQARPTHLEEGDFDPVRQVGKQPFHVRSNEVGELGRELDARRSASHDDKVEELVDFAPRICGHQRRCALEALEEPLLQHG